MELFVDDSDVDRNQEQARLDRDTIEEREDIEEEKRKDIRASFEFLDRLHLLLRTAEILGQILKNNYGSLERPVKVDLMREVLDAPLRLLRAAMEGIASEPENLVNELETVIDYKRPGLKAEIKKKVARHICFQILGMISTGAIMYAARFVNTDKLDDDIRNVIEANPTSAYRLVGAATRLMRPGEIPIDEIRRLSADLKSNVFAFTILQSLAGMHLHLFHTGDSEKQGLCEHLNISMATSRAIDIKKKSMKLLEPPK